METIGTPHGQPSMNRAGGTQADELKEKASHLTHTARGRAVETLDARKGELCSLIDRLADSMQDDPLGRHATQYVRRGSDYLRGRSADEILDAARTGIRERPGMLLGACFVAGLAVARVLRR